MLLKGALVFVVAASLKSCAAYEYEHEFWLRVDGSGTVNVTGRPALWAAFKGVESGETAKATQEAVRAVFERSGLRVRRVALTRREGRPYIFVAADFADVNRLSGSAAFPDLRIGLRGEGVGLALEGTWRRPRAGGLGERDGFMAVRFHLPSRVYTHKNAAGGVERGNIVSWRQEVAAALDGRPLDFGATMDRRSILGATVTLFAASIATAVAILGAGLFLARRRGRRLT